MPGFRTGAELSASGIAKAVLPSGLAKVAKPTARVPIRQAALRTPSVLVCQEHRKPLPRNGFASAGARLLDARMSDPVNLLSHRKRA